MFFKILLLWYLLIVEFACYISLPGKDNQVFSYLKLEYYWNLYQFFQLFINFLITFLYFRENKQDPQLVNLDNITDSYYTKSLPNKFILHGYNSNFLLDVLQSIKNGNSRTNSFILTVHTLLVLFLLIFYGKNIPITIKLIFCGYIFCFRYLNLVIPIQNDFEWWKMVK